MFPLLLFWLGGLLRPMVFHMVLCCLAPLPAKRSLWVLLQLGNLVFVVVGDGAFPTWWSKGQCGVVPWFAIFSRAMWRLSVASRVVVQVGWFVGLPPLRPCSPPCLPGLLHILLRLRLLCFGLHVFPPLQLCLGLVVVLAVVVLEFSLHGPGVSSALTCCRWCLVSPAADGISHGRAWTLPSSSSVSSPQSALSFSSSLSFSFLTFACLPPVSPRWRSGLPPPLGHWWRGDLPDMRRHVDHPQLWHKHIDTGLEPLGSLLDVRPLELLFDAGGGVGSICRCHPADELPHMV